MNAFAYFCLTASGAETRGVLEAADEITARRKLKEQGLKVLSLAEDIPGISGLPGWREILKRVALAFSTLRSINNSDRTLFFQQMSLMLKTGHTLLESLSACGKLSEKGRVARVTGRSAENIRRGKSLSAAIADEKELFNRLSIKLIEAGEASGELGAVFERLSGLIERRVEVRRQLVTALIYPGVILVVGVLVVTYLVMVVVPRFTSFLAGRGKAVPWAAQTLMDIADWVSRWGWAVGLFFLLLAVGIPLARRFSPAQFLIDRFALMLPVLGGTFTAAAMAQSAWIFSILIKSRLTVLEALRICAQASGNAAYSQAFSEAANRVLMGKSLTAALEGSILPPLVRHMAAVGEKSGQVDTVMDSLGNFYQKTLDARVKMIAALIEPVLLLQTAAVVGFVYYAFFQAMMSVSTGG